MASGSVIRYDGKRGRVFRLKYRDATGRQVMETLGPESDGWTEDRAKEALQDRLSDVRRKAYAKPKPLTFRTYAERWFEEEEVKRRWKPATVRAYRFVRERLVEAFGPMKLDSVRPRHVADLIAHHPNRERLKGASTVRRDVDVLHAVFKSAMAAELVQANPVDGAERPKLPPFRPVLLEPEEIRKIANAFTSKTYRAVFLTVCLTGLRRSELMALRWCDVDLVDGVLWVRESKSEDGRRKVALSPSLVEELAHHKNRSPYNREGEPVFASRTGRPFRPEQYSIGFRKALKAAGVAKNPRPFHDGRHGALTAMAATGASPIAVMTIAGHASMATTKRYLHLAGTVFPEVSEKLDFSLGLSTNISTDLTTPDRISGDSGASDTSQLRGGDVLRPM